MLFFKQLRLLLRISRSQSILRRYFVVNGFDGALTMLGLIMGFLLSETTNLSVIINACLGASIALFVSGIVSAYISEKAERQRILLELENAMQIKLAESVHGQASRYIPIVIALVNGMAPFVFSLLIILPLWLSQSGVSFVIAPLYAAALVALLVIFLLGIFLGQVAGNSLIISGCATLIIALLTLLLIHWLLGN